MAPTTLARSLDDHLSTSTTTSLIKRAAAAVATTPTPWQKCKGCRSPDSFNNKFFFALFAILAVFLVAGSIWFFFFAKNGGFQYEEGDWTDYKSAVLRRKGPDGKSMAASSRSARSVKTGMTRSEEKYEEARWAAMTVVARDEKGRKGILAARGWGGSHSCTYKDDFTDYGGKDGPRKYQMTEVGSLPDVDVPIVGGGKNSKKPGKKNNTDKVPGAWDTGVDLEANRSRHGGNHSARYKDRDVSSYAREKPARVGGMNRAADGSHMDFSGSEISSNSGHHGGQNQARHSRAEKRVLTEAEKMERQWRREARRAARELERGERGVGADGGASSPVKRCGAADHGRTPSPTKKRAGRDFSFSQPANAGGSRESYMDAYRPGR